MKCVRQLLTLSVLDIVVQCILGLAADYEVTHYVHVPVVDIMANGRTVFVFIKEKRTWNEASHICKTAYSGKAGSLAKVDSQEAHQVVTTLLTKYSNNIWFGLYNAGGVGDKRKFMWADVRCTHFEFGNFARFKGQPDEQGDDTNKCYYLADEGMGWTMDKCSQTYEFICEYQDFANSTCEVPQSGDQTAHKPYKILNARFFNVEAANTSLEGCSRECTKVTGCFLTSPSPSNSLCLMGVVDDSAATLVKAGCVTGRSQASLQMGYSNNDAKPAPCVSTNSSGVTTNTSTTSERTTTRVPAGARANVTTTAAPSSETINNILNITTIQPATITIIEPTTIIITEPTTIIITEPTTIKFSESTTITITEPTTITITEPTTITITEPTTIPSASPVAQSPVPCLVPTSAVVVSGDTSKATPASPDRPTTVTTTSTYVTTIIQPTTMTVTATTTIISTSPVVQSPYFCAVTTSDDMVFGDTSKATPASSYHTTIQPAVSTRMQVTISQTTLPSVLHSSLNPVFAKSPSVLHSSLNPVFAKSPSVLPSSLNPVFAKSPSVLPSSLNLASEKSPSVPSSSLLLTSVKSPSVLYSVLDPTSISPLLVPHSDPVVTSSLLVPHSDLVVTTSLLVPHSDLVVTTSLLIPHPDPVVKSSLLVALSDPLVTTSLLVPHSDPVVKSSLLVALSDPLVTTSLLILHSDPVVTSSLLIAHSDPVIATSKEISPSSSDVASAKSLSLLQSSADPASTATLIVSPSTADPSVTTSLLVPHSSSDPSVTTSLLIPRSSSDTSVTTSLLIPRSSSDPSVTTSLLVPLPSPNPAGITSRELPRSSPNTAVTTSQEFPRSSPNPTVTTSREIPLPSLNPAGTTSWELPHSSPGPASAKWPPVPDSSADTSSAATVHVKLKSSLLADCTCATSQTQVVGAETQTRLLSGSRESQTQVVGAETKTRLLSGSRESQTQVVGAETKTRLLSGSRESQTQVVGAETKTRLLSGSRESQTQVVGAETKTRLLSGSRESQTQVVEAETKTRLLSGSREMVTVTVTNCEPSSTARSAIITGSLRPTRTLTNLAIATGLTTTGSYHKVGSTGRLISLAPIRNTTRADTTSRHHTMRSSTTAMGMLTNTNHHTGLPHLATQNTPASLTRFPDIAEMTSAIISNLLLDEKKLSKTRRKKESAPDGRMFAQVSGCLATVFVCALLSCVIILDLPRMFICVKDTFVILKT